jgi:O-antigen ligase
MVILSIFLSPLVVGYMYDMIIGRSAVERVSNNLRSIMWESAWPYFYKSPILGWGEGSAANFVGLYLSSTKTVDDSYLSMLLNGGISGVFLFFAFFIVVLFRLIIARVDESDRFLNAAWFSSIVAVLVCQKITSIPFLFGLAYLLAGVSVVRSLK